MFNPSHFVTASEGREERTPRTPSVASLRVSILLFEVTFILTLLFLLPIGHRRLHELHEDRLRLLRRALELRVELHSDEERMRRDLDDLTSPVSGFFPVAFNPAASILSR